MWLTAQALSVTPLIINTNPRSVTICQTHARADYKQNMLLHNNVVKTFILKWTCNAAILLSHFKSVYKPHSAETSERAVG